MNRQDFYTGFTFDAHDYFGAHIEGDTTTFRTFAPNARRVSLICQFNNWQEIPMDKTDGGGFYQYTIDENLSDMLYKYRIYTGDNSYIDHCDPYGFGMELRPNNASIVRDLSLYTFNDQHWIANRSKCFNRPMNIYEMHLGSWKKSGPNQTDWYTYNQLADFLIPYLKENNYNYVEMLPISEHPMDCSWGYQNTGFFSPTSRYGTATQLMELIDKLHQAEIGVFIDFVPVHFAVDNYALANYDGTPLYEYPNDAVGVSEWGSCNFMHSRGEVRSFLQSCADYWIKYYHFDGIRMDAISNMIYWQGDANRGVNNLAVSFLQTMNSTLHKKYPNICLMAEDSTNYPSVTKPVSENGLEFDYKWDMGWMNDTIAYFNHSPKERTSLYHKLTFSMMYYYNEKFLLPFSHDEVVHGKGTMVNKMYGTIEERYTQARALYLYMYVHPGKKLNFMGNEAGQLREWNQDLQQDLSYEDNSAAYNFNNYMKALNKIYLETAALYEEDYSESGFQWLDCHQEDKCIYVIKRTDSNNNSVISFFNFSNEDHEYILETDSELKMNILLDTQDTNNYSTLISTPNGSEKNEMKFNLPKYSGLLFKVL